MSLILVDFILMDNIQLVLHPKIVNGNQMFFSIKGKGFAKNVNDSDERPDSIVIRGNNQTVATELLHMAEMFGKYRRKKPRKILLHPEIILCDLTCHYFP